MRILKLHTTTSTNTFFKEWIRTNIPENFMIIAAEQQTQGRGQRGNSWLAEPFKNLTFSIFIKISQFKADRQFELNQAISLGLIAVLNDYIPTVQIKWPNDIMADNYKIGGILIENTVSKSILKHSIIGIGLNVNQTQFSKDIPNASSLKNITGNDFILEDLLIKIQNSIKKHLLPLEYASTNFYKKTYLERLYLYQKKAHFQDEKRQNFKGKIIGVSTQGRLQIKLNSTNEIREFGFKEIKFLANN